MPARVRTWWAEVQDSLWFLPAVLTASAAALAGLTVWLDRLLLGSGQTDVYLAFGGGVEGARGVLSAIAGSLITVTGVVFSITIVALQLASSQFTPRVLRSFTGDRANQLVLGVFIGTFTYTLLVLRTVRSAGEDGQVFVPSISVGISIGLALVSVAFLIFYIHHAARSIQASVVIDRVTRDTRGLVDRLFPEPVGAAAGPGPLPAWSDEAAGVVEADRAGYLQAVDADGLFELAARARLTIAMEPRIGEFILPGGPLASIWGGGALGDDLAGQVRHAFLLGPERTLQYDLELGLRQLADIAIRALSPGINDPTTAENCIDRLAEILVLLGNRQAPDRVRSDAERRVCLVARATSFERAVALSFDQIRHYGLADPRLAAHLLESLGRTAALVPAERRAPLYEQAEAVLRTVRASIDEPLDLARLAEAAPPASDRRSAVGSAEPGPAR